MRAHSAQAALTQIGCRQDALVVMKIRVEQLKELESRRSGVLEFRMIRHLSARFPAEVQELTSVELGVRIKNGLQRARCYGLVSEEHLCSYLELDMIYGADFDVNPESDWAGQILRKHRLTGEDRLRALEDHELFTR